MTFVQLTEIDYCYLVKKFFLWLWYIPTVKVIFYHLTSGNPITNRVKSALFQSNSEVANYSAYVQLRAPT